MRIGIQTLKLVKSCCKKRNYIIFIVLLSDYIQKHPDKNTSMSYDITFRQKSCAACGKQLSGKIDKTGTLIGGGSARKSGMRHDRILRFSAEFEDGSFQANIDASGSGGGSDMTFRITLTRVSP